MRRWLAGKGQSLRLQAHAGAITDLAHYAAAQGDLATAIEFRQPAADFPTEIGHPLGPELQQEIEQWRTLLGPQ